MPISDPAKRSFTLFRNKLAKALINTPQDPYRPITAAELNDSGLTVTQKFTDAEIGTVVWEVTITRKTISQET